MRGAMGRLESAILNGEKKSFRELVDANQFWSFNGTIGMTDAPLVDVEKGETVKLQIYNDTSFPHAMHLHGLHFREIGEDGRLGPLRDTILMFGGQMLGLVDVGHMSVKAAHGGVLVGGLLLGLGWALAGYCPGTGLVALGAGRRDALAFVAGGLLGAAAYMVTHPAAQSAGLLDPVAGGKVTLGTVPGADYPGLTDLPGDILGIVLGLAFVAIAFLLPERLKGAARPVAAE